MELRGKHAQHVIQTLSVHLLLASGKIGIDDAVKALETDRALLKTDRRTVLEFAEEMMKPLVRRGR